MFFLKAILALDDIGTTVPEKNNKGTWYGWKIDERGKITDGALYSQAKALAVTVNSPEFGEQTKEDVPF